MLLVVFGLPGTGKTFLAKELAGELGLRHLNTDGARKKILSRPGYTDKEKEMVYSKLFEFALEYLKRGDDVVIDGTFYKAALREKIRKIAKEANTKPVFVELTAPEEVVAERVEDRKKRKCASEADYCVYQKIKREFEPMDERHLVINSTMPLLKQVERVRFHLKKGGLL